MTSNKLFVNHFRFQWEQIPLKTTTTETSWENWLVTDTHSLYSLFIIYLYVYIHTYIHTHIHITLKQKPGISDERSGSSSLLVALR